jgi:hypothetical protein
MTTPSKPRVRVRADSATINTVRQIMTKAGDEIADAVDVVVDGQPYGTDWPVATDRVPNARENPVGRPLDMSGNGPQQASEAYSQPATMSQLMRAYDGMAELLMRVVNRVDGLEKTSRAEGRLTRKAIGAIAVKAGMHDLGAAMIKSADDEEADESEDADGATDKARKSVEPGTDNSTRVDWSAEEAEFNATEKAALGGNAVTKTMAAIVAAMQAHVAPRAGLATPPDMSGRSAVAKSRVTGPTDDEILQMNSTDAVEALSERQRNFHRQRLGLI